ncbi:hypothetical protein FQA39_LY16864 [Lamprigera yunnana]|nr:hypothetical protein FQA39_LY16864 [Lamprigera yunnana]
MKEIAVLLWVFCVCMAVNLRLPEFDLDSIEPVRLPSLRIGEGKGAVSVEQNYKNVEIHNLHTLKVIDVKSVVNENEISFDVKMHCDDCYLAADYNFNGHILVVPIVGTGNCTVHLLNSNINFKVLGEMYNKKEKKHMKPKEVFLSLEPKSVHYQFNNLFNGDVKLGEEMNKLLNDNSLEVFNDIKSGYEEALASVFTRISNQIYKKVPYDELFPL